MLAFGTGLPPTPERLRQRSEPSGGPKADLGSPEPNLSVHQSAKQIAGADDICAAAHLKRLPRRLVHLLCDENSYPAPSEMPHPGLNFVDSGRLNPGEGFIEQQKGRSRCHRPSDFDPAAFTAQQRVRHLVAQPREIEFV